MGDKKELVGVNGWLLFFLIIFIISVISIPLNIYSILQTDSYAELLSSMSPVDLPTVPQPVLSLKIVHVVFLAIAFISLLLTIIAILKKQSKAKKLSIISIWTLSITGLIGKLIPLTMIQDIYNFTTSLGISTSLETVKTVIYRDIGSFFISGIIWAIVVTLYFIKSKRVKNTLTN